MPITGSKKVSNAFYSYVIKQQQNAKEAAITALNYVGLECINEARQNGKYTDQSGNLRSSINYVVLDDGVAIRKGDFKMVKNTATEAKQKSEELIAKLSATYKTGLVLVVVAGMDYAVYVEARGYNVLNSAETLAKKLVPQMLKELGLL